MSKFKVYQIQLTKDEVEMINTNGHNSVPKQKMRLGLQTPVGDPPIAAMAKEALAADYYTHVANIEAYDLEDVFECGNIGPDKNIERLSPMMTSISVGDVVEDEDGVRHVVAIFGFEEVA